MKEQELLSELVPEFEKEVEFTWKSVNLVPARYDFGGPRYWEIQIAFSGKTYLTYWNGGAKATDPTLAEFLSLLVTDFSYLRAYRNATSMIEDIMSKPRREYGLEEWETFCEESRRSWKLYQEERTSFIATFGLRWYNRLMRAENDL